MSVARYYEPDKNPEQASLPGVPLRDLEDEEFAALPEWLQAPVDATPFYRKTNPAAPRRKADSEKEG